MRERQNVSRKREDLDFLYSAEVFFKNAIQSHFNRLIENKKSTGFNWKVTNKKTKVIHYVIGTCHPATKNMIDNIAIQTALKNTKLLVSDSPYAHLTFSKNLFNSKKAV